MNIAHRIVLDKLKQQVELLKSYNRRLDDAVIKESSKYICNYAESMELTTDEKGKVKDVSFPAESTYTDNGNNVTIDDCFFFTCVSDFVFVSK